MQSYQGSCHCGTIRFGFTTEPITKGLRCNCSLCIRKGALMSAFVLAPEQLTIESGLEFLGVYQFGSRIAKHHFCTNCGVYTFHQTVRAPGQYRINLGCVEGLDICQLPSELFDGRNLI
ncbi:MAG: GFA family protein [Motiliproteus sp.]